MRRDDEDRILHGLYFYRENIDAEFRVTSPQILWLAMHPLPAGGDWAEKGQPQSLNLDEFPDDIRAKLLTSKFELPLRYLQYRRLIKIQRQDEATLDVAVTFAGADRAIRLHTRRGRIGLWYRENKDGLAGIMITVLVSAITALITVVASLALLRSGRG